MNFEFLVGLVIGTLITGLIDAILLTYLVFHPKKMRKIVSKSKPLLDRWEGEFDTGYYGPIENNKK